MPTRPEKTQIERLEKGHKNIQFRIPGSFNETVRQQILTPLVLFVFFGLINTMMLLGGGEITDTGRLIQPLLLLLWLGSIGGLLAAFQRTWGYTRLDLTPSWIQVRYEVFGLGISRRIPTAAVTNAEVSYRGSGNNTFHVYGVNIYAGRKTLKFGSHLTGPEKRWLVGEIKRYLSTIETPAELSSLTSKISASAHGIKIAMAARNNKEAILFSKECMTLEESVLWPFRQRHFEIRKIETFRLDTFPFRSSGKIMFDYNGTTLRCCRNISDAEARTLFKHLTDILNFRCYAVERIVFGDIRTDDDRSPSDTLHNPDVSELSFPFAHLQQVVIDAPTHNSERVEKFLTYAVNYIGRQTLKACVTIRIHGDAEHVHPNLRNAFQDHFKQFIIEQRG